MPLPCLWHMRISVTIFSFRCPKIKREVCLLVAPPWGPVKIWQWESSIPFGAWPLLGMTEQGLLYGPEEHWWPASFSFSSSLPASVQVPWERAISPNRVPYYIKWVTVWIRSGSVTCPPPPSPVFFSTCPCHSLSVWIPLSSPVFPPAHLKSSRFYLGKGDSLCFGIFRVQPWILQLLASNLSLSGVRMCEAGEGWCGPWCYWCFCL